MRWKNWRQRRADLVPNPVETAKAIAAQEKAGLTSVVEARARRNGVQPGGEPAERIITVIAGLWICFVTVIIQGRLRLTTRRLIAG